MFEYDTKRLKFFGILLFLLVTFCAIVGHAYKYIPEEGTATKSSEEVRVANNYQQESEEENEAEQVKNAKVEEASFPRTLYETKPDGSHLEVINVEEENANGLVPIENLNRNQNNISSDIFAQVREYKRQENYSEALKELKRIITTVDSNEQKAQCYEEIALIYGLEKHYGSSLAFAQKAYNLYPTTNREVLLARLYYKTGDTERAINRINNVLKRDFWADR